MRLSRTDWTDAALVAMAEAGTAGVNIEQLARNLSTTKGSFYHHFENRQALLQAALTRWEEIVDADNQLADQIDDPYARLIAGSVAGVGSNLNGFVDLALSSSVGDPVVAEALARTNQLRIIWLTQAISAAGFAQPDAEERAIRGLSTYLGLYQLQRTLGETFDQARMTALITSLVEDMLRA